MIEYDAKVTKYWPEFGQHGKGDLTVSDILRHEGGLPKFHKQFSPKDLLRENIKKNSIGKIIETDKSHWPLKRKREYHQRRDLITNEIFRRADHKKRTMGEFLDECYYKIGLENIKLGGTKGENEFG
jgi:hypothetical protein